MLNSFFFSFEFHRFCQSGGYLDFFFKKFSEIFVKNVFIYGAIFFGEKYMIENWTKNIFKKLIFLFNLKLNFSKLNFSKFFIQLLSFLFYSFSLILIFF